MWVKILLAAVAIAAVPATHANEMVMDSGLEPFSYDQLVADTPSTAAYRPFGFDASTNMNEAPAHIPVAFPFNVPRVPADMVQQRQGPAAPRFREMRSDMQQEQQQPSDADRFEELPQATDVIKKVQDARLQQELENQGLEDKVPHDMNEDAPPADNDASDVTPVKSESMRMRETAQNTAESKTASASSNDGTYAGLAQAVVPLSQSDNSGNTASAEQDSADEGDAQDGVDSGEDANSAAGMDKTPEPRFQGVTPIKKVSDAPAPDSEDSENGAEDSEGSEGSAEDSIQMNSSENSEESSEESTAPAGERFLCRWVGDTHCTIKFGADQVKWKTTTVPAGTIVNEERYKASQREKGIAVKEEAGATKILSPTGENKQGEADDEMAKLSNDPKVRELQKAFIAKKRKIAGDMAWISKVKVILRDYQKKLSNVRYNVAVGKRELQKDRNKILRTIKEEKEQKLESELKAALGALGKLESTKGEISKKISKLHQSKASLKATVDRIRSALGKGVLNESDLKSSSSSSSAPRFQEKFAANEQAKGVLGSLLEMLGQAQKEHHQNIKEAARHEAALVEMGAEVPVEHHEKLSMKDQLRSINPDPTSIAVRDVDPELRAQDLKERMNKAFHDADSLSAPLDDL